MSTAIFGPIRPSGSSSSWLPAAARCLPKLPRGLRSTPREPRTTCSSSTTGLGDSGAAATPEDAKAKEDREALEKDFAALEAKSAKEKARIEPLRKDLAALEAKDFGSFKERLAAALKSPHRAPGNAERDKFRHPAETLGFFNLRPDMAVLELDAGTGWYTELLAPVLKKGKLTVSGPDPSGPTTERATFYGKSLKARSTSRPRSAARSST